MFSFRSRFEYIDFLRILFAAHCCVYIYVYIGGLNVRERFLSIDLMKLTGMDGIVKLKILGIGKSFSFVMKKYRRDEEIFIRINARNGVP